MPSELHRGEPARQEKQPARVVGFAAGVPAAGPTLSAGMIRRDREKAAELPNLFGPSALAVAADFLSRREAIERAAAESAAAFAASKPPPLETQSEQLERETLDSIAAVIREADREAEPLYVPAGWKVQRLGRGPVVVVWPDGSTERRGLHSLRGLTRREPGGAVVRPAWMIYAGRLPRESIAERKNTLKALIGAGAFVAASEVDDDPAAECRARPTCDRQCGELVELKVALPLFDRWLTLRAPELKPADEQERSQDADDKQSQRQDAGADDEPECEVKEHPLSEHRNTFGGDMWRKYYGADVSSFRPSSPFSIPLDVGNKEAAAVRCDAESLSPGRCSRLVAWLRRRLGLSSRRPARLVRFTVTIGRSSSRPGRAADDPASPRNDAAETAPSSSR